MFDLHFLKRLVVLNGLVPIAILLWDAWRDQLGANKVNYAIHVTGIMALVFLVLSLFITPLRKLTGWNSLIAYRRALGLYGFFYAVVHLFLYVAFDRAGNLESTWSEIASRLYLQVGLASLFLMAPLAVTSSDLMIRKLGPKRWKLLHRLAYVAIALGGLHYLLLVKSDIRQPVAFLSVIGTLLVGRLGLRLRERRIVALKATAKNHAVNLVAPVREGNLRPRYWKGKLQVAKIFFETPDVKTFRLIDPEGGRLPFDYQPGQYLNFKLSIDGKIVPRSYTIASSPTRRDYCEVTIKREPQGLASRHIHDTWRESDLVELGAPAGKFTFLGQATDEVVLIGGGVGVTPVMSMLRYLTDRAWKGTIQFILVVKSESDWIFRDEIVYLERRHANLNAHIFLTRSQPIVGDRVNDPVPQSENRFHFGRLNATKFIEIVPRLRELPVFLCGPDAMMQNTRDLLVELGVDPIRIHSEAFTSATMTTSDESATDIELGKSEPPVARHSETRSLTIRELDRTIEVEESESILDAVERCSIDIPYECRSGICGQCKLRLCEGQVHMEATYALSPRERKEGWILACQSHLTTDATIGFEIPSIRQMPDKRKTSRASP